MSFFERHTAIGILGYEDAALVIWRNDVLSDINKDKDINTWMFVRYDLEH